MLTPVGIILFAALLCAVLTAAAGRPPLWVSVILLCIACLWRVI